MAKPSPIVQSAISAIDRVHEDESVPLNETIRRLKDIKEHADALIEACLICDGRDVEEQRWTTAQGNDNQSNPDTQG